MFEVMFWSTCWRFQPAGSSAAARLLPVRFGFHASFMSIHPHWPFPKNETHNLYSISVLLL